MEKPKKLRLTPKPSTQQKLLMRNVYPGVGKRTTAQWIELRDRYNRELQQHKERYYGQKDGSRTFLPDGQNAFIYKQYLQNFKGQTVKVYSFINGEIYHQRLIDVPYNDNWWENEGVFDFLIGPSGDQRTPITDGVDKIVITPNVLLEDRRVEQLFREGVAHCFFQPILEWAELQLSGVKSKTSINRYSRIIRNINNYIKKYEQGVPESHLQEIADTLHINIEIDFPLAVNNFLTITTKTPLTTFRYVNTRLHHLDLNELVNKKFIETEQDEFDAIVARLDETGEHYDYRKDKSGSIIQIRTLKGNYAKVSEFMKICGDFEFSVGICDFKIDGIEQSELWSFVNEGNLTTGSCQWVDDPEEVKHIDMERAYANFFECPQYEGFLGKITDFRKCHPKDFLKLIGYFQVVSVDVSGCPGAVQSLLDKFNYLKAHKTYPSVELKFWERLGVNIEVDEGCWGTTFDFRFTEDMFKYTDGPGGPRCYSKWCGIQESFSSIQSFQMKGTKEFFENMKSHLDETGGTNVSFYADGEGTISYPKAHSFGAVHITGFIKMYQRLTLINQMMKMEFDKIIGLCTDGIFYKEHEFEMIKPFRPKEGKLSQFPQRNLTNKTEDPDEEFNTVYFPNTEESERDFYQKELFIGAGGNGKTYYNLNDKGTVKPIYIAPAWKLCAAKHNEFGCKRDVLANLLLYQKIKDFRKYYNVLIIDECSQICEKIKNQILETYPHHKIIFCGDLGYQLPPTGPKPEDRIEMNTDGFDNITELEENEFSRIKCDKQRKICKKVRQMIDDKATREIINNYVKSSYENINTPEGYKPEDIILCSKTRCSKHKKEDCNCDGQNYCFEYTQKFGDTKWRCLKRGRTNNRGDIKITNEKPGPKTEWEVRHGYTIHSVQGETFKEIIFIDARNLFDARMAYTAISRAEYACQIKIIV